jgi:hypothetical protein
MTDMKKSREINILVEEIKLFLRYAVPTERWAEAVMVVERYQQDITALRLLHEFYRSLPEVREEPVVRIVELAASQGVKLLAVLTDAYDYLYVVDADQVLFAGENGREIEEDALAFFGYPAHEDFRRACRSVRELEDYGSLDSSARAKCPVCSVLEGEYHQFGCPVEVCPWCQGQMNRCNCRFDLLGVAEIGDEEEIGQFQRLLIDKGRIRFSRQQAPAYPSAGNGLEENEGLNP